MIKATISTFCVFTFALCGQTPPVSDISAEFDVIRQYIQQRDFLDASRHTRNLTNFAIARLAQLPPNSGVVAPLPYAFNGGDLSLLLTIVEQNRVAFQTNDFLRLLKFSMSLSNALQEESVAARPTAGQALSRVEQKAAGLAGFERFLSLPGLAKAAFAANDLQKSSSYANELLSAAAAHSEWPQGQAIHFGNMILGRVAFANGDVASASSYLLKAGKTAGSPSLNSFGPNMALANDLVNAGQRDVVLQYLAECATFWKSDKGELARWAAAIQSNKAPDFGANITY